MRCRFGHRWSGYVAALTAVALLAFAGVRSNVMQAAEGSGAATPMCGMAGMSRGAPSAPGKAHTVCDFCVAAAQAPLASAPPVLAPPAAVVWRASPVRVALGPRGPPAFRPRARGPPALLTV